jgi:hypothetical protein
LVLDYLLNHPCVRCGENDPACLDFDHRDRRFKKTEVTRMVSSTYTWNSVKKEIDKCDVRCSSCHRKKTAKENGWYEKYREILGTRPEIEYYI